jgi:hypothetical protein
MSPEERFEEIHAVLAETAQIQREQAGVLLTLSKKVAEHDERMERIDEQDERIRRHLEVLIAVVDDLVRGKK